VGSYTGRFIVVLDGTGDWSHLIYKEGMSLLYCHREDMREQKIIRKVTSPGDI
jgi:hypothetical protein